MELAVGRRGCNRGGGDDGHHAAAGPEGRPDALHTPRNRGVMHFYAVQRDGMRTPK